MEIIRSVNSRERHPSGDASTVLHLKNKPIMIKKHRVFTWITVCYGLLGCLLLVGCGEEEQAAWIRLEGLDRIDTYIKEGVLLKTCVEEGDHYTLAFENQTTMQLPAREIERVEYKADKWMTVFTFTNNQEYSIPTLGESLEGFVKEITVNPSGYCPLAASVRLDLPAKGCFKVKVRAKPGAAAPDIEHRFAFADSYSQDVTVLGLYADYTNQVDLIFTDKEGNERGRTAVEIPTAPLHIKRLPKHHTVVRKTDRMEPGMTLVSCPGESEMDTSLPYMVDADGEVRWVLDWQTSKELLHIGAQCGLSRMKNGHYAVGDFNNNQLAEVDVLGNVVNRCDLDAKGYSFHHEVFVESDGKWLVAVSKKDAKLRNGSSRMLDHIIEFDPTTATVAKEWDMATLLDTARYGRVDQEIPGADYYGQSASNWLHNNGVSEMNGQILATARWQGVFLFSRQGDLKWIIAPHTNWRPEYARYLLQPLDKNGVPITDREVVEGRKSHPDFDWAWGVHCPKGLPNGNVLVFDNGYCRNYVARKANDPQSYSRVVEYKVNERDRTIQQVWSYGLERGLPCYASATSGVQYLPLTGNRLFCPSTGQQLQGGTAGGRVIEIDPASNEVVYELEVLTSSYMAFHRAARMALYPDNL